MKTTTKCLNLFSSLFFLLSCAFTGVALAENVECTIADHAIKQASEIRGLKIKEEVPCFVRDRPQIEAYLVETIDEKVPEEQFSIEEYVYKRVGILPYDFDYRSGLINLYLSQIGGYYDPVRNHFVMASWMPQAMQSAIAVHELTHALQDQYFDLTGFMNIEEYSSDEIFARSALVEGDATAVMMDYVRAMAGQPPLEKTESIESIMLQNVVGASMMDGFAEVPESLQKMVLFPYISGLRFAHNLLQKGGYEEINRALKNPPRSTEEILHPEKYFKAEPDFIVFSDKDMLIDETLKKAKVVFDDTFGEFMISALLGAHSDDKGRAARTAVGWGGDRIMLFQGDTEDHRVLVWRLNWDSVQDAQDFYLEYGEVLKKLYPESEGRAKNISLEQNETEVTVVFRSE